ncbi:Argonaute1, partial [Caligus rogercresseyi]
MYPGGQTPSGTGLVMPNLSPMIATTTTSTSGSSGETGAGSPPFLPPGGGDAPIFVCPRRPNIGKEGKHIMLKANHFQ